jgi:hypothetical protein
MPRMQISPSCGEKYSNANAGCQDNEDKSGVWLKSISEGKGFIYKRA